MSEFRPPPCCVGLPTHMEGQFIGCHIARVFEVTRVARFARSLSLSSCWPLGSTNHDLARKEFKKFMLH